MSIYNRIIENQNIIESGKYRNLPYNWGSFDRLVSGIITDVTLIAGQSSSAKSSFAKFLYLIQVVEFAIEKNINYKCIFFALEDTKEVIEYTILCNLYWKKYGEIIDIKLFEGLRYNENKTVKKLTKVQLEKVESLRPQLEQYLSYVEIYDDIYEPNQIYNQVLKSASTLGIFYKNKQIINVNNILNNHNFDSYEINPNTYVTIVTDNVNLLEGDDLYKAILYFSFEIGKKNIVKKLGFNHTMLQQLADVNADLEHKKANDWLPSSNALGQAKKTAKDSRLSLGTSNPYALGFKTHLGYQLEDYMLGFYRCINIFKQTMGITDITISTIFIPQACQFYILPKLKKEKTSNKYEEIPEETQKFIESILKKIKDYEQI